MPQRPDLRQIAGNIREALADCERETLLDMLTFVFKEYVVEGPPPLLAGQVERIPDLEGLSFAQLIRALQTRLDLPELNLFQVDGEQVSVRVGGVLTPLDASRSGASRSGRPAEPPRPPAAPVGAPSASARAGEGVPGERGPGVRVVETELTRQPPRSERPRAGERDAAGQGTAPPPRQGLSVRGRPGGGGAPASRAASPGAASGGASAQEPTRSPAAAPARPQAQSPEQAPAQPSAPSSAPSSGDEDIATTRFSLLELD